MKLRAISSMPKIFDLRQRADLYRRLANVPTAGGHRADRILLTMADQLEQDAAELEEDRRQRVAALHISNEANRS
jgi:hypothetical protein